MPAAKRTSAPTRSAVGTRAGGTNPSAERLLAAAEAVADELGWRGDAAER